MFAAIGNSFSNFHSSTKVPILRMTNFPGLWVGLDNRKDADSEQWRRDYNSEVSNSLVTLTMDVGTLSGQTQGVLL